ncbi:MAG: hypothetical protein AB8B94_14240 [Hyphomicrobiales bacterium]
MRAGNVNRAFGILCSVLGLACGSSTFAQDTELSNGNLPSRYDVPGYPYTAANDKRLADKKAEMFCLDGQTIPGRISSVLVVPAHQPDYPVRPMFFGKTNKQIAKVFPSETGEDPYGKAVEFVEGYVLTVDNFEVAQAFGDESFEMYLSALIYVTAEGDDDKKLIYPLVAHLTNEFETLHANESLRSGSISTYRIDCDAGKLNSMTDEKALVVAPLGRADLYQSISLEIEIPNGDPIGIIRAEELRAQAQEVIGQWANGSEDRPQDLSPLFLFEGGLQGNLIPFQRKLQTYGDIVGYYLRYQLQSAKAKKPQPGFIERLPFPVTLKFIGLSNAPHIKIDPTQEIEEQPDQIKHRLVLEGDAFRSVEDVDLSSRLTYDAACDVQQVQDATNTYSFSCASPGLTSIHLLPVEGENERGIALFSSEGDPYDKSEDLVVRDTEINLRDVPDALVIASTEDSGWDIGKSVFESTADPVLIGDGKLSNVVGAELEVGDCHDAIKITLEMVLQRSVTIPAKCLETKIWTVEVDPRIVKQGYSRIITGCLDASTPVFDVEGKAQCTVAKDAEVVDLVFDWSPSFRDIKFPVTEESLVFERYQILETLILSDSYLDALRIGILSKKPGLPKLTVDELQFFNGSETCGAEFYYSEAANEDNSVYGRKCLQLPDMISVKLKLAPEQSDMGPPEAYVWRRDFSKSLDTPRPIFEPNISLLPLVLDKEAMQASVDQLGGMENELTVRRQSDPSATGWRIGFYDDAECKNSRGAEFLTPEMALEKRNTWPIYSQVSRLEKGLTRLEPGSNCVPVKIRKDAALPDQGFASFDFDILVSFEDRSVIILALSAEMTEGGRFGVVADQVYDALNELSQNSTNTHDLELWNILSTGEVLKLTSVANLMGGLEQLDTVLSGRIEKDSPRVPNLKLLFNNTDLDEVDTGAILMFDGSNYDEFIEIIYSRLQAIGVAGNTHLFLLNGCKEWTRYTPNFQKNCVDMIGLDTQSIRSKFASAIAAIQN